jgi:large conductance mechanosensitive channel
VKQGELQDGIPLTDAVNFVVIGATIYFVVVMPVHKLAERRTRGADLTTAPREEVALLTEIRDCLRAGS